MPILVRNVVLGLDEPEDLLIRSVAKRLRVPARAIRSFAIVRRSLDARKKDIRFSYHLEVALDEPRRRERARLRRLGAIDAIWIKPEAPTLPRFGSQPLPERPFVIGFGPGGMFAALRLARLGYRPVVFERGRDVRRRHRDVLQRFYRARDFDPSSNLLFGEGGAGTYSDGKLYTRTHDPLCRYVLEAFYHHGADPDVLINARPHIGSDRLPTICARIRRRIESLGGEVRFESRLEDIRVEEVSKSEDRPRLTAIRINGEWLTAGPTLLSIGHSARDTIRMLAHRGVQIEAKPFQIGVRIEHPQSLVDRWQYGAAAGHRRLMPADYQVVAKGAGGAHGDVFSFCMCPGGMILPAIESPGLIVTNGASRARRSSPFANSGFVITLNPAAMGLTALDTLAYQERWERRAFELTDRTYRVPAQRASDYLHRRPSSGEPETSYPLGAQWVDIRAAVPDVVGTAIERALPMLEAKFSGFAGDEGVVTAPETRASAPIRITRDAATREAIRTGNLYPVGEGAGYAAGIISTAVDGIKTADTIVQHYAPLA